MTQPDLTVYIPTYNRADFLRECLAALVDQGLPRDDYVVAIADNNSSDETRQVVAEFEERLQIDYLRRPTTVSMPENVGGALEMTRTPYMSLMCDDDLMAPGQLGRAMSCLRPRPEACLYAALGLGQEGPGDPKAWLVGMFLDQQPLEGEPFLYAWSRAQWLANCSLHTPMTILGSVFRVDRIPINPIFPPEYPQEGDRVLLLSMVDQGQIFSSPWVGGYFRTHSGQESKRNTGGKQESARVNALVLAKAEELGVDLIGYWAQLLQALAPHRQEFYCRRIRRAYPKPLAQKVIKEAGIDWGKLKARRKKGKGWGRSIRKLLGE